MFISPRRKDARNAKPVGKAFRKTASENNHKYQLNFGEVLLQQGIICTLEVLHEPEEFSLGVPGGGCVPGSLPGACLARA